MSDMKKHVEALIEKSAQMFDSGDAMRFAQAALNAANAVSELLRIEEDGKVNDGG